jgi:hypothetical protein
MMLRSEKREESILGKAISGKEKEPENRKLRTANRTCLKGIGL